ncbi:MAG: c-type cytochrome biogenesis protein CcsB [Syntrophales bacterium]|jgi:cytochrome c-type biogenesis protein CcsB|nr:c-type cytochrome biogenesis protein CcsB [Syntrophales bacterium]
MADTQILSIVTFIYLGGFLAYLVHLVSGKPSVGLFGTGALAAGFIAHTVALLLRWKAAYAVGYDHPPLTNFYESLIFFSWTIILLYLIMEWRTRTRILGLFVVPVAFLCLAFASLSPDMNTRIQPLIPALQSNWLTSHVLTCFMGYAAFTTAFGTGILFLIGDLGKNRIRTAKILTLIPQADLLEELIYKSVLLGFILLTLGIFTGSVWAHYAWGSYWSWDPKETWSLITWLIYAVLLHGRYAQGWRGRRLAVTALVGFAAVLFTYLGVNYLPGLHSYL